MCLSSLLQPEILKDHVLSIRRVRRSWKVVTTGAYLNLSAFVVRKMKFLFSLSLLVETFK